MTVVFEHLAEAPIVLIFLLIGVGMFLGHIKIKGVGLGAAAVLFLAIALSAWGEAEGVEVRVPPAMGIFGLALFAFAIGNNSGASFFQSLKKATGPILSLLALYCVAATTGVLIGKHVLGMDIALIAGTFAGATTNTPALAAAGEASGDPGTATVGYAVAYLFGVIGMIIAAGVALRGAKNDNDAPAKITHKNVRVERRDKITVGQFIEEMDGQIEVSRMRHGEVGDIWIPDESDVILYDDLLTIVGTVDQVDLAIRKIGHQSSHSLRSDRRYLDFRRITISKPKFAGMQVRELDAILEEKWDAKISRVRRGDNDMLAVPDLMLEMGDRVRVVGPTMRLKEISQYLGDSSRGMTDINPVSLGLGLALGAFLGELKIPIPGGGTFSIGVAAGVLIVGLIMGKVGRIGPLVTALPNSANAVLAELGLLMFLAQAGTNAGGQIAAAFTGGSWWKILLLGALITTIMAVGLSLFMRKVFKMGGTMTAGLLGGAQTQPAVMAFANDRTGSDPRIAVGYALVYPVAMIGKILVAHVIASL